MKGKLQKYWVFFEQKNKSYQFKIKPFNNNTKIRKRNVSSETVSVFDRLRLISLIIVHFKLTIQILWR